jgi:hypothetical protein
LAPVDVHGRDGRLPVAVYRNHVINSIDVGSVRAKQPCTDKVVWRHARYTTLVNLCVNFISLDEGQKYHYSDRAVVNLCVYKVHCRIVVQIFIF